MAHKEKEQQNKTKLLAEFLKSSKFPEITNLYTAGWNDAIDLMISEAIHESEAHS